MTLPKRDQTLLAEISGVARRLARGRTLTGAERQEAAATLSEVARGRADLLAECARLALGAPGGSPDEARRLQVAQLCIDAGADLTLIPQWTGGDRRPGAAVPVSRAGAVSASG
jgi:hypothetical protein